MTPRVVYRNKAAKDGFPGVEGGAKTLYEVFEYSVKRHGNNKCLGWRPMSNGKPGPYEFWTYNETRGAELRSASYIWDFDSHITSIGLNTLFWSIHGLSDMCTLHMRPEWLP